MIVVAEARVRGEVITRSILHLSRLILHPLPDHGLFVRVHEAVGARRRAVPVAQEGRVQRPVHPRFPPLPMD